MFFAILGESQAKVREDESDKRRAGQLEDEYGVFTHGYRAYKEALSQVPVVGRKMKEQLGIEEFQKKIADADDDVMEVLEAKQDELKAQVDTIAARVQDVLVRLDEKGGGAQSRVLSQLEALMPKLSKLA